MTSRQRRIGLAFMGAVAAALKLSAGATAAGILWIHLCGSWTPALNRGGGSVGIAASVSTPGITTPAECPAGQLGTGLDVLGSGRVSAGKRSAWQINAPASLAIVGAHTVGSQGLVSYGVNQNMGWGGGFYWRGGGAQVHQGEGNYSSPLINSPYFGWHVICGSRTCDGSTKPGEIGVLELEIAAVETSGPSLVAAGGSLAAAEGWVRGWWPVSFSADGPTGACQLAASLGGVSVSQPVSEPQSQTTWHQCPVGSFSQSFNTASVASGASIPLVMWARDAAYDYQARAYLSASVSKSVNVDNEPVSVSLSGPTDAPTTAGVQHVTATATAGPSGVQGITCTADGGPAQSYAGATAQVPVSGIGAHTVRCAADNNAVDGAGGHGWSSWSSWALSIRQPTVSGIGFSKLVDSMLCHRVRERVTVPGRWVTVMVNHKLIHFRDRAHRTTITVARCHPRIERRRITVWATVTRDGKLVRVSHRKTIRVVVMPHVVTQSVKHVGHGRTAVVDGWLGLPSGTALAGQVVHVLTAPDDGLGRFSEAAVTTTRANGSWVATLSAGPSRLVEALYGGDGTLEPSTSSQVHVVVPAKVRLLSVSPRHVAWGGTVRIVGQLVGGYLPPGGALVRLRLGQGSGYTTYGVAEHVTGSGRFATTYTFGAGLASVHQSFWFQIASLPMGGDYPWAPADSRRVYVVVGGHPASPAPGSHRRRGRSRRARHRRH